MDDPEAAKNPELMEMVRRNQEFYVNREDRPGLVRMKWRGVDFPKDSDWGAMATNYFMASRVYEMHGDNPVSKIKDCNLVEPDGNGKWTATTTDGKPAELADGKYIFVRMVDRSIRIAPYSGGGNAHSMLAGHAAYVTYAGEVTFENGKDVSGCPQSGTYMPPPDWWGTHSGLHCEASYPEGSDFSVAQRVYQEGRTAL